MLCPAWIQSAVRCVMRTQRGNNQCTIASLVKRLNKLSNPCSPIAFERSATIPMSETVGRLRDRTRRSTPRIDVVRAPSFGEALLPHCSSAALARSIICSA
jgi:hypothetical protein